MIEVLAADSFGSPLTQLREYSANISLEVNSSLTATERSDCEELALSEASILSCLFAITRSGRYQIRLFAPRSSLPQILTVDVVAAAVSAEHSVVTLAPVSSSVFVEAETALLSVAPRDQFGNVILNGSVVVSFVGNNNMTLINADAAVNSSAGLLTFTPEMNDWGIVTVTVLVADTPLPVRLNASAPASHPLFIFVKPGV